MCKGGGCKKKGSGESCQEFHVSLQFLGVGIS
jgi:hypothetical protein